MKHNPCWCSLPFAYLLLVLSGGESQSFCDASLSTHHEAGVDPNNELSGPAGIPSSEEVIYKAAVVEYNCPSWGTSEAGNTTAVEFMMANVDNYKQMAQQASELGADIIVFPEYGITSLNLPADRKKARQFFQLVADPAEKIAACDQNTDDPDLFIVGRLSCTARELKLYMVVDLAEVLPCDNQADDKCPDDGHYFFNTAVAFDRDGVIIARYRKIHLYLEPQMNYPPVPTPETFITDFGVEFGMFVCFDIMFEQPMVDLHNKGIRNFVFPTAWVDAYPMFLGNCEALLSDDDFDLSPTAHQVQSFTAIGLNANLLASGYHNPPTGSVGSGIYSVSTNSTVFAYSMQTVNRMVVADVVSPPRPDFDSTSSQLVMPPFEIEVPEEIHNFLPTDFSEFNFTRLEPGYSLSEEVCDEKICCQLSYSMTMGEKTAPDYSYALGAFSGRVLIQNQYSWMAQACVVILCTKDHGDESCGQWPNAVKGVDGRVTYFRENAHAEAATVYNTPHFDSFVLSGDFATSFIYPSGIDMAFKLLVPSEVHFSMEGSKEGTKAQLETTAAINSMAYAGLYGRLYAED